MKETLERIRREALEALEQTGAAQDLDALRAVSYTHLTLPTICSV